MAARLARSRRNDTRVDSGVGRDTRIASADLVMVRVTVINDWQPITILDCNTLQAPALLL